MHRPGAFKQGILSLKNFSCQEKKFILTQKNPIFQTNKLFTPAWIFYLKKKSSYIVKKKKFLIITWKKQFLDKKFLMLVWKTNFLYLREKLPILEVLYAFSCLVTFFSTLTSLFFIFREICILVRPILLLFSFSSL